MDAPDPPVAAQVAPAEDTADVIEVIGTRTDSTVAIDRRTYTVRETPLSVQKDAAQLLRTLPAVTITPDDRILILGSGVSRLYVNGHPYLGDISQYLHTLHGSDIARIEVITNPSAQFSAEGAGGVINLILRTNEQEGLSGNASYQASSYALGILDSTLNYAKGDWTGQLKVSGNSGVMVQRSVSGRRRVLDAEGTATTANGESGEHSGEVNDVHLSAKATYALDAKTSLSAQVKAGGGHDVTLDTIDYSAISANFTPYFEHRRLDSHASYLIGQLNLDHEGDAEGASLKANLQGYTNPALHNVTVARFDDGRSSRIDESSPSHSLDAKLDWKHPLARRTLLSLGASWHVDASEQDYAFTSSDAESLGADASDSYAARSSTLAAYASVQQSLGALTLAPGLRAETNRRRITSPGLDTVTLQRAKLFPSFHASWKAAKSLRLGASYSRRIDRVPLEYLRPYTSVEDVYTTFQGNPDLADQSTDAYELSASWKHAAIEASATLYLRKTSGLWSKDYTVAASGSSLYTYVNAGTSWNSGGQFDLGLPILKRVKLRASANLFDARTPVDSAEDTVPLHTFRYTTNGTLEWTGKDRAAAPGDVAQVQWSWNSPSRSYQTRTSSWYDVSLAWTHSFDPTLSLTGTFRYAGASRQRTLTTSLEEITNRQRTPEVQLKLYKTF